MSLLDYRHQPLVKQGELRCCFCQSSLTDGGDVLRHFEHSHRSKAELIFTFYQQVSEGIVASGDVEPHASMEQCRGYVDLCSNLCLSQDFQFFFFEELFEFLFGGEDRVSIQEDFLNLKAVASSHNATVQDEYDCLKEDLSELKEDLSELKEDISELKEGASELIVFRELSEEQKGFTTDDTEREEREREAAATGRDVARRQREVWRSKLSTIWEDEVTDIFPTV